MQCIFFVEAVRISNHQIIPAYRTIEFPHGGVVALDARVEIGQTCVKSRGLLGVGATAGICSGDFRVARPAALLRVRGGDALVKFVHLLIQVRGFARDGRARLIQLEPFVLKLSGFLFQPSRLGLNPGLEACLLALGGGDALERARLREAEQFGLEPGPMPLIPVADTKHVFVHNLVAEHSPGIGHVRADGRIEQDEFLVVLRRPEAFFNEPLRDERPDLLKAVLPENRNAGKLILIILFADFPVFVFQVRIAGFINVLGSDLAGPHGAGA